MNKTDARRDWPVLLTACFALVWIVHRAIIQSITIDEANTFLFWVAPGAPAFWIPNSNNHILNSMLMRFSVSTFGLSDLTVRIPALLGGAIYLFAVYRFCALCMRGLALRWALFVCFVFNPFLMDYLVAARGYGLALGFLSLSMYLVASLVTRPEPAAVREIVKRAAAISVCAGLSFSANFSFAFANACLIVVFFAWVWRERRRRGIRLRAPVALACVLPGAAVTFAVTGSVLASFTRDQLLWGAHSLYESWIELRRPSMAEFDQFNAAFVSRRIGDLLSAIRPHLLTCGAILMILYVVVLGIGWRTRNKDAKPSLLLPGGLAAVLFLTVLVHWLQFRLFGVLLPLERTALWFVFFLTAVVGAVFAITPSNLLEHAVRGLGIAVVCVTAIFFFATLRDSHFGEWRSGADVKAAFPVLWNLCRQANIHEVAVDPAYVASLNFYRIRHGVKDLSEFSGEMDTMPPRRPVYVLSEGKFGDFIRSQGLTVAYRGPTTDLVIAVRP